MEFVSHESFGYPLEVSVVVFFDVSDEFAALEDWAFVWFDCAAHDFFADDVFEFFLCLFVECFEDEVVFEAVVYGLSGDACFFCGFADCSEAFWVGVGL